MRGDEVVNTANIELRCRAARQKTGRGLILVVEGVEGVGKTTTCATLHEQLRRRGIASTLLIDQYERTGCTGPGIAAVTEDPGVKIETDLTLFLLYCARFCDKAHLAWRLGSDHDVVLVDRFDLSLRARAISSWSLPEAKVDDTLAWSKEILRCAHVLYVCLDANRAVREQRILGKPIRRRSLLSPEVVLAVHNSLLEDVKRQGVPIVDTSTKSPTEVIRAFDTWLS